MMRSVNTKRFETLAAIWADFKGHKCVCGAGKKPMQSFCFVCYRKLPRAMREALYSRIGNGYEAAFRAAVAHLKPAIYERGNDATA